MKIKSTATCNVNSRQLSFYLILTFGSFINNQRGTVTEIEIEIDKLLICLSGHDSVTVTLCGTRENPEPIIKITVPGLPEVSLTKNIAKDICAETFKSKPELLEGFEKDIPKEINFTDLTLNRESKYIIIWEILKLLNKKPLQVESRKDNEVIITTLSMDITRKYDSAKDLPYGTISFTPEEVKSFIEEIHSSFAVLIPLFGIDNLQKLFKISWPQDIQKILDQYRLSPFMSEEEYIKSAVTTERLNFKNLFNLGCDTAIQVMSYRKDTQETFLEFLKTFNTMSLEFQERNANAILNLTFASLERFESILPRPNSHDKVLLEAIKIGLNKIQQVKAISSPENLESNLEEPEILTSKMIKKLLGIDNPSLDVARECTIQIKDGTLLKVRDLSLDDLFLALAQAHVAAAHQTIATATRNQVVAEQSPNTAAKLELYQQLTQIAEQQSKAIIVNYWQKIGRGYFSRRRSGALFDQKKKLDSKVSELEVAQALLAQKALDLEQQRLEFDKQRAAMCHTPACGM